MATTIDGVAATRGNDSDGRRNGDAGNGNGRRKGDGRRNGDGWRDGGSGYRQRDSNSNVLHNGNVTATVGIDNATATQWRWEAKDINQLVMGAAKARDSSEGKGKGRRNGNGDGWCDGNAIAMMRDGAAVMQQGRKMQW